MVRATNAFLLTLAVYMLGCPATTSTTTTNTTNTRTTAPTSNRTTASPPVVTPPRVSPPPCDAECQRQKCEFPLSAKERAGTEKTLTKAALKKRMLKYFGASVNESEERGVSGKDDRTDYYEMPPHHRALADSTVLVTWRQRILVHKTNRSWLLGTGPLVQFGMKACDGERFANQGTGGFCSGFLISKDVIVTAGHCLGATPLNKMAFVFGFRMDSPDQVRHVTKPENVFVGKSIIASQLDDSPADYALIRLNRPVPPEIAKPLPINFGPVRMGQKIGVIGYPSGLPVKAAFGTNTRVAAGAKNIYFSNLDTFGGNSGSAIFNEAGEVIGLLIRGATDYRRVKKKNCFKVMRYRQRASREVVSRISQFNRFIPKCLKQ